MRRYPRRIYRRGGNPSVAFALLILGAAAYSQYGDSFKSNLENISFVKEIKETKKAENKKQETPRLVVPNYVKTQKATFAFNDLSSMDRIATIPTNSSLKVMDYRLGEQRQIAWFRVKADGLSVWIRNNGLIFE